MSAHPVRLKNRSDFLLAARMGEKAATRSLILQCRRHDDEEKSRLPVRRLGFTVSRKVGNAVVRNRTRRRLKAAADKVMDLQAADHRDYVIIGRAATNEQSFGSIVSDLKSALKKVNARREPDKTVHATQEAG